MDRSPLPASARPEHIRRLLLQVSSALPRMDQHHCTQGHTPAPSSPASGPSRVPAGTEGHIGLTAAHLGSMFWAEGCAHEGCAHEQASGQGGLPTLVHLFVLFQGIHRQGKLHGMRSSSDGASCTFKLPRNWSVRKSRGAVQ